MARAASRSRRRPGPGRFARVPVVHAAATVLALFAWGLAGDRWWVQPVTLTTFWWTLPGLGLAVMAGLLRRWRAAALFAVPALVFLWCYGTLFLSAGFAATAPDLRLASYNTYVNAPSIASIVALADDAQPDIMLLQEVFPSREAEVVAALGDRYPYHEATQSPGVGGVMVLSRHAITDVRPVSLSEPGVRETAVVTLDVEGRALQVVAVHLTSPCPSCGSSMTERLEVEAQRRPAELASVLRALDPRVPVVVGGDFNSTERSAPYRLLSQVGFEDPHRAAGSGPGFTWPNDMWWFPALRIDWVLTRGLVAADAWVGDGGASDHRPVIVDLAFPEAA